MAALLHHISSQHKGATCEAAVTSVVRRQYAETFGLNCPLLALSYSTGDLLCCGDNKHMVLFVGVIHCSMLPAICHYDCQAHHKSLSGVQLCHLVMLLRECALCVWEQQAVQTGEFSSSPTVLAPALYDGSSSEAGGCAARQAWEDGFWDRPVMQHHAENHIPTILQRCGSPQGPACQMGPHTLITQPGGIHRSTMLTLLASGKSHPHMMAFVACQWGGHCYAPLSIV